MTITNKEMAPLHERIVALDAKLAPGERAVARFLSDHPDLVATATAQELAERIGTSNATVIRTVKALGYKGLPALRRVLVEEMAARRDPTPLLSQRIGRIDADESTDESIAHQLLESTVELMKEAHRLVDEAAWHRAVDLLHSARSVLAFGIEQPGCVAELFAIEMSRCGRPTRALTASGITISTELINMSTADALVVFAPLRNYREIDVVVDYAQSIGVPVIFISEALGMSFQDRVDVVLSTPPTTRGIASEVVVPLVLARALSLAIASRDRATALDKHQQVKQIRAVVTGGDINIDIPLRLPPQPRIE